MSTTTCKRAGCEEDVDRSEGVWPYCSRLCGAIDKEAGDPPLPPPPIVPIGPQGARTERPGDTDELPRPRGLSAITFTENEVQELLANEHVLPIDSEERKQMPIFSGVMNYFPLAIAAVARHSKFGNDKHNPGQPLHWARGKSQDHADCIARHLIDHQTINLETGEYDEARALAWRALALLQELEEKRLGKPFSRGSR